MVLKVGFCMGMAGIPAIGHAQSLEQWQRAIQVVGDAISDAQRRREAEEAAEAERQRQQYELRQRAAAAEQQRVQQARAEAQRVAALSPPPRYDGRIVLHRQLLEAQRQWPAPFLDYSGNQSPAWSPDGASLAYLHAAQVHWLDLAEMRDRPLPLRLPDADWIRIQFLRDDVLLVTASEHDGKTYQSRHRYFLLDRQGTLLGQGQEQASVLYHPGDGKPRYLQVGNAAGDCKRISVFDAADPAGKALWTLELGRKARECNATVSAQGHHELLVADSGRIAYYRDGVLVRRFGSGIDDEQPYFVPNLPYAYVSHQNDGGGSYTYTLSFWDIDSGRSVCTVTPPDGSSSVGMAYAGGKALLSNSSLLLSLPECGLERLPGVRAGPVYGKRFHELVSVYGETGRITILDTRTWQPVARLQVDAQGWPSSPDEYYKLSVAWHPQGRVLFGLFEAGETQEFDAATGRPLGRLPGGASLWEDGRYLLSSEGFDTRRGDARYRVWRWDALHDDALTRFLASLVKDKYETREQFRQRLATASAPYTLEVALADYDADRGAWTAQWQGIPLQVPMAPAQARRLEGVPRLVLEGRLHALDPDYLELQQPHAVMPDGQRAPLPVATHPLSIDDPGSMASMTAVASATSGASAIEASPEQAAPALAHAPAVPPGCSESDYRARYAQMEREIATGAYGICGGGRLGKRLAEETLAMLSACPSTPAMEEYRREMEQLRSDSLGMIEGACGD